MMMISYRSTRRDVRPHPGGRATAARPFAIRWRRDRVPPRAVQSSIISSRVTGAFTAVLVILVLAFVASVHGASRLADLDLAVAHARDVVEEIGVTSATLHEVES